MGAGTRDKVNSDSTHTQARLFKDEKAQVNVKIIEEFKRWGEFIATWIKLQRVLSAFVRGQLLRRSIPMAAGQTTNLNI
jgi:hypothetical protein